MFITSLKQFSMILFGYFYGKKICKQEGEVKMVLLLIPGVFTPI